MRWLMEGGGDGHDIHLQVPVVLSIFHVQNEDSLKTAWDFLEFWFQGPPRQVVNPTLAPAMCSHLSPVSPNVLICFYFTLSSWISTWPQESCWEQRAAGEATEAGGGWGGSCATPVLCCRLGPTWTEDANTPRGTGEGPAEPRNDFTSTWPKETLVVPSHSHLLSLCFGGVNNRKILVLSDSSNSCLPQLEKPGP